MNFEFATATRIVFGKGALKQLPEAVSALGSQVLIVTGQHPDRSVPLKQALEGRGLMVDIFSVDGEPTVETILSGAEKARSIQTDAVIGLGGGSPVDTGKAIAALLTNSGDLYDYLEVIGKATPIANPPAPYVAVPTTAGTGAEVTRNAVIGSPHDRVKVSMRSPLMLPRLAVIDPLLTVSMSPETTAATGLDALTQVIEPFVSNRPNPITDNLCREGMRRAAKSLKRAFQQGDNLEAREDMCVASLFGGLALANAKLGAVHGIAGPIGGMFDAPHGAVCAKLLPHVIRANVRALRERAQNSPALAKFDETARLLTGKQNANAEDAVDWLGTLCDDLTLPALSTFGLRTADIPVIAEKSKNASSMKGNPIALTDGELAGILKSAI